MILDVNDNYPQFEKKQYKRNVEEGATEFKPQFFIKVSNSYEDYAYYHESPIRLLPIHVRLL